MNALRWLAITCGALILTTLGINAFDNLDTPGRSLLGAAFTSLTKEGCPEGMVFVGVGEGGICVDAFEAAPGSSCTFSEPQSGRETNDNLTLTSCKPVSAKGVMPWRSITRQQAELACARVGKRLPTTEEWYRAGLGTPDDEECNIHDSSATGPRVTGKNTACATPQGVHDMVGNVWEWVQETVEAGSYKGSPLPAEGYITETDENGMPRMTHPDEASDAYFKDYFWLDQLGTRGIIRGGYWNSGSDAGAYAVNITVPPSFVGNAVGFRCVKDLQK